MSLHCRMETVGSIFMCMLVQGMSGVSPKPSSSLDQLLLPPQRPDAILSTFFSGLKHNQVVKLLPSQDSNQHINKYRTALKKHILGRSDVKKKSSDSLEGRSDPGSILSAFLLEVSSTIAFILKHKEAVLSFLVATLAFQLAFVFGALN